MTAVLCAGIVILIVLLAAARGKGGCRGRGGSDAVLPDAGEHGHGTHHHSGHGHHGGGFSGGGHHGGGGFSGGGHHG